MKVHELIEYLRRFPQDSEVICEDKIEVDTSPMKNNEGFSMFYVDVQDKYLPEELQNSINKCEYCGKVILG